MFDEGVEKVSQFLDGPSRGRSTERDNNRRPSESRDREPAIDDVAREAMMIGITEEEKERLGVMGQRPTTLGTLQQMLQRMRKGDRTCAEITKREVLPSSALNVYSTARTGLPIRLGTKLWQPMSAAPR